MRTVGISNQAAERFAAFVDLDAGIGIEAVTRALRASLNNYGVPWAWILETQRGHHVVAPFCFTFKDTLAFHRSLNAVGADDDHRRVAITNGRFILRVTEKPGSPAPTYKATIHADPGHTRRQLLVPIAEFYEAQMDCPMPETLNPRKGRGATIRLEAYDPLPKVAAA